MSNAKVTHLPYMGPRREVVMTEENQEVLFASGSALGLIVEEFTPAEGSDPLEIMEAFEEWLMEEHGLTLFQAAAATVRGMKSKH